MPPDAVEMTARIEGQPRWARAPHPTPLPASGEREGPADPRIKSGEEGEGQPAEGRVEPIGNCANPARD